MYLCVLCERNLIPLAEFTEGYSLGRRGIISQMRGGMKVNVCSLFSCARELFDAERVVEDKAEFAGGGYER